jgi:hypothetical protein
MWDMNLLWGAARIHSDLLKLGIDVCEAMVAKYMARRRSRPSLTWRAFFPDCPRHETDAGHAGVMLAFSLKKLSGSYFALIAFSRAMLAPYAVVARESAFSSA